MFVSVTFIAMLIWFATTLLVYEIKINGDKFYCRKSMRVADEILTINELGPYVSYHSLCLLLAINYLIRLELQISTQLKMESLTKCK